MTPLCLASSFDGLIVLEQRSNFGLFENVCIKSIQDILDGGFEQFLVAPQGGRRARINIEKTELPSDLILVGHIG